MRCIAIDDEPLALSIISSYLESYDNIELTTYTNPQEGMAAVESLRPEVLFLDIEMNDYSGLKLARTLPPQVILIFTTAHASYALNGYEVGAVDFLHKPFSKERFDAALSRAEQIIEIRARAGAHNDEQQITIKVEYQNITIPTTSITYIEAMDNYVKINISNRPPLLTKMSIKYLMELLPKTEFIRTHRSFIVAKSQIRAYTKQSVNLDGEINLPVGRRYGEELFRAFINR